MYILSQNKKTLVGVNLKSKIYIEENYITRRTHNFSITFDKGDEELGVYSTEKDAIKVLEKICLALCDDNVKVFYMPEKAEI